MFMTSFKKLECLSFENTSANRGFKKFEFPSHDSLHSRCTPWRWPDMHQLARCSQLCELDVDFRHIGPEQAIAALQNLVKLRRLIVSGARIHDVLEALPSLQSLQCGRNTDWRSKTSSASSECKLLDIQPHSALRSIELEHTTWYRFLPYLVPNLQHIYIYIDDVIPSVSELLAWRHLVSLRLHVVDIDLPNGYVRRLLKGLSHLVTLNIVVGYFPWQDKLQVERPMLPKLTELVLRKCRCFTVEAILGYRGSRGWISLAGAKSTDLAIWQVLAILGLSNVATGAVAIVSRTVSRPAQALLPASNSRILLQICRAVQHSPIHDAYLTRVLATIPPMDSEFMAFRSQVHGKLTAIKVIRPQDLSNVVTTFPKLTQIRLEGAAWTSTDIRKLTKVTSLMRVYLIRTKGIDITPLGQFPRLQHLDLRSASFSGDLGAFSRLRSLALRETPTTSIEFVTQLPLLRTLTLDSIPTLVDLSPLGRLPNGHNLDYLGVNYKHDIDLAELTQGGFLSSCRGLQLLQCSFRPSLHEAVAKFTRLRVLSLPITSTDAPLESLSCVSPSSSTLRHLDLQRWLVEDIAPLAECLQLEILDINLSKISPSVVMTTLRCLVHLRVLAVRGARIHDVLEAAPRLRQLRCDDTVNWTDKTHVESGTSSQVCRPFDIRPHTALEKIVFWNSAWYSHVATLAPNVKHLTVAYELPPVHERLAWPALTSLKLYTSEKLPEGYVPTLVKALPYLTKLYVQEESTEVPLLTIQTRVTRKITELTLKQSRVFTIEALLELHNLKRLDLTGWAVSTISRR